MRIGNSFSHRRQRQHAAVDLSGFLIGEQFGKLLNRWKQFGKLLYFVVLVVLLTACTGQDGEEGTPVVTAEPTPIIEPETAEPTQTAAATPRISPTPTALPVPTTTPSPIPTSTPVPRPVNGIPVEQFIVFPPNVREHMAAVFALGQEMERNPGAYSILGDSTALNPQMMGRFEDENLNLGQYYYLQPAVEQFGGYFGRYGVAARHGLHSWSIFDPLWADKKWCLPNETLLACEFRLRSPSILIIRLGSNDAGSPDGFRFNIKEAIEFSLENGVMPVVATKADRFEGPDNANNIILRELAAEYEVPLWDFDVVAETLPGRGLDTDGIHMVEYLPNDYSQESAFESGHAVQDLTGLMMLYTLWREVIQPNSSPEAAQGWVEPAEVAVMVNGVPVDAVVVLPEGVKAAMTAVYQYGRSLGRIPNRFAKIGDSHISTNSSMLRFDTGEYNLGDYGYLQSVIDFFSGSFERFGVGTESGMRSWSVFDLDWSDPKWCEPEENLLECEIRLHNPAVVLVVLGTNDTSEPEIYVENMRRLVEYCLSSGVIPLLMTKADRHEGPGNRNNDLLRQIAADYQVPLIDFDLVAATLPGRGLGADNVHLLVSAEGDYDVTLQTGYGMHNLAILMGLYGVWQEIIVPAETAAGGSS